LRCEWEDGNLVWRGGGGGGGEKIVCEQKLKKIVRTLRLPPQIAAAASRMSGFNYATGDASSSDPFVDRFFPGDSSKPTSSASSSHIAAGALRRAPQQQPGAGKPRLKPILAAPDEEEVSVAHIPGAYPRAPAPSGNKLPASRVRRREQERQLAKEQGRDMRKQRRADLEERPSGKAWLLENLGAKNTMAHSDTLHGERVVRRGQQVEELQQEVGGGRFGSGLLFEQRARGYIAGRLYFAPRTCKPAELNDMGDLVFFVDRAPNQGLLVQLEGVTHEVFAGDSVLVNHLVNFVILNASTSQSGQVSFVAVSPPGSALQEAQADAADDDDEQDASGREGERDADLAAPEDVGEDLLEIRTFQRRRGGA
jgi:hypothetical protein